MTCLVKGAKLSLKTDTMTAPSLGRRPAFLSLDFAIEKHQIRSNSTYFINQFYIGFA